MSTLFVAQYGRHTVVYLLIQNSSRAESQHTIILLRLKFYLQREADALSRKLQYKIDFMDLGTEKLKQLIVASDDQKAERLDRIAYSRQNIADESLKAELYEEELNQLNKQLALCDFASEVSQS